MLLVTALFISLFAGCTSSKKKSGEVTLTMIEAITSPARTQLLRGMLDRFEEQNPGIKVEIISPPMESASQKINQMLLAEEDLDIVEVRGYTVKQYVLNGYLEDLTPYVDKWSHWDELTDYAKSNATTIDNTPYVIPYGLYMKMLYYRADWFEELGLEPPKTWDELYEIGKKLTDPSKERYGYSFRGSSGTHDYVQFMTWAFVGRDIDPEEGHFLRDGSTMFNTSEAQELMAFYKKLYEEISPPDSINWGYPEMVQGFYGGVTGMLIQDPEVVIANMENMEDGTWATAPLPVGPSGVAQQTAAGAGWGITSYSKHKEEAWKLMEFLLSPEESLYFSKENSVIPIYKAAREDEYFNTGYYKPYLDMSNDEERFVTVKRPIQYKGWGEWQQSADQGIQSYLLGRVSAEELLEEWDAYWLEQRAEGTE